MPVVSARGTSATQNVAGWFSPLSSIYDAGIDTWVYGTGTSLDTGRYIEIAGHNFIASLGVGAIIADITISARAYTVNYSRWKGWNAQFFVGGVAAGPVVYQDMGTSPTIMTYSMTGVTADDLIDPDMVLRMEPVRNFGASTADFYIDYADVIVTYTPGVPPIGLGDGLWGAIPIL